MEQAVRIVLDGVTKSTELQTSAGKMTDIEKGDLELMHLTGSFDACLATFSTLYTRSLIAKAQQRNSLLPIYRLPTEVIIKIFKYYVEIGGFPHSLELVSSVWAVIVRNSPILWRHINSNQPRSAYLNSLARSKDALLVVKYTGSQWRFLYEVSEDLKLFMETACGQVHRWQSATLLMDTKPELSGALFDHLAQNPAPLLEKLDIDGTLAHFPSGSGHMNHLFGGVAPSLRHLTLKRILISWDSGFLSHLLTLTVMNHMLIRPTASQMARIMHDCPLIVELGIECSRGLVEEGNIVPIGVQLIELLALKVLSLHLTPIALNYILQVIRIPNCTQFHIISEIPADNIFSGATDHLIPVLAAVLHSAEFIEIYLSATHLDYTARQNNRNLIIIMLGCEGEQGDESPLSTLGWMLDHIHSPSLSIPIELSINAQGLPLAELFASFQPYPITAFKILLDPNQEILQHLTRPVALDGVSCWHLPSLQELSLGEWCGISLNAVLSLVESRLGRLDSGDLSGQCEPPVKLLKLRLTGGAGRVRNVHIVQKLKALVDDVVFQRDDENIV
ncbi:hypothetical protein FRB95_009328 [Tulasnella sp. JGI-2019a]|nr:hypothetical protein FRB95_009328 [Tulasnella sp. JGI-2019a]